MTPILICGILFAALSVAASVVIFTHAFSRSVGTGVITLFVPGYVLLYAFSQFEHRQKGWLVSAWLGFGILSAVLLAASIRLGLNIG